MLSTARKLAPSAQLQKIAQHYNIPDLSKEMQNVNAERKQLENDKQAFAKEQEAFKSSLDSQLREQEDAAKQAIETANK